VKLSNKK